LFTPDGQRAITLGGESIRIWDPSTGDTHKILYPPGTGSLAVAALSPEGERLALARRYLDKDTTHHVIYILALRDGQVVRTLQGHTGEVKAVAFSPDGKFLASAAAKGDLTTRVWNLDKDEPSRVVRKKLVTNALAFSPDSRRLACVGGKGALLDLATGKKSGSALPGFNVAWSPDGKVLATAMGQAKNMVRLQHEDGTERMLTIDVGKAALGITSLSFSGDSQKLLVTWHPVTHAHRATLFDVASGKELLQFPGKLKGYGINLTAQTGALSPDGALAITGGGSSTLVWKTQDGAIVKRLAKEKGIPGKKGAPAGWSADGKAVSWNTAPAASFHLGELQMGAPLTEARGAVLRQGDLTLEMPAKYPQPARVLKDGKVLTPLKVPQAWSGTFIGKDQVAVGGRFGDFALFDVHSGNEVHRFQKASPAVVAPSPDNRFLLTVDGQKLRIWKPDVVKPLLTLHMRGQDWIIWTPEYYYAASPGGERLLGFLVDNGIDTAPSYYPAERFRKQLYRPDVIKLVLEKGSVEEALKAANLGLKSRGIAVKEGPADLEMLLPPIATLQIIDKASLPKLRLKASAVAAVPNQLVTGLRLLLDGRPLPEGGSTRFDTGVPKAEAEWTVTIPPGKHQLTVLARSPDASALSESIEINVGEPAKEAALHVLTVGINQYDDSSLNLEFATKDARALAEAFVKHGKGPLFGQVQVTTLVDKQAQRQAILDQIQGVRKHARDNDLFVVFFAGHGVKEKEQFYLLTVEAQTQQLAKTALSGDDLRKALGEFPCQVLLMLDACHSAGFGEGGKLRKQNLRPATDDATRALTDDEIGVAVMCAAMGHEKALEKSGNGLFTRAVLEALQGGQGVPRHPRTGRLYLHHLQAFVFDRVSDESEDRQHPFLSLPWVVESFPVAQFTTTAPR
jgi:hypothetical protein